MKDLDLISAREIVDELDKYVIGQHRAKKIIAIALRNRHRRMLLSEEMRDEIAPKNIILIGSTGVGKTEIARRISKLFKAPFIKVEATKYTEVGYVGRDVESMVRDLAAQSIHMVRDEQLQLNDAKASDIVCSQIYDILKGDGRLKETDSPREKEHFIDRIKKGDYDDWFVEIEFESKQPRMNLGVLGTDMDDLSSVMDNLKDAFSFGGKKNKTEKKNMKIKDAIKFLKENESEKFIDENTVRDIALERVQSSGIIFIDEIDKIAGKNNNSSQNDISREGVQRDILPIVEGTKVNTKYGIIDTTHILFIAAGAFHVSKPSDLIPELQGRFPLRVELEDLKADDFYRILTEPENALIKQYKALLSTEDVNLEFDDKALRRISSIAEEVNRNLENIGARRLHTIMENLLEDVSFNADSMHGQTVKITESYVDEKLQDTLKNQDLSSYIL